jgi:hypothetical protein
LTSTGGVAAPDGTKTFLYTPSATNGIHFIGQNVTVPAGQVTLSFYAKAAGYNWLRVAPGSMASYSIDVLNGVAGASSPTAGLTIVSLANGWYRVSITGTQTAGSQAFNLSVNNADSTSSLSFSGDGTSGVYIWGVQVNVGPAATNLVQTAALPVYMPRVDYEPVSKTRRGLLIEEQRVNLVTFSQNLTSFAPTRAAATLSSTLSPDGVTFATQLTEDSTATSTHYQGFSTSVTSGTAYTHSVFAKAGSRSQLAMFFQGSSAWPTTPIAYFDLAAGTVISTSSGTTAFIQPIGNGWYRCAITATAAAADGAGGFACAPAVSGNYSYTGNGSGFILLWGKQVEAGLMPTSLIPTYGSSVTRVSDAYTTPFNNGLVGWQQGTVQVEFTSPMVSAPSSSVFALDDGSNNGIMLYRGGGGGVTVYDGASTVATGSTAVSGVSMKVAVAWDSSGQSLSVSVAGNAAKTLTSAGPINTPVSLSIGTARNGIGFNLNGWIKSIRYRPVRVHDSKLAALTA